MMKATNRPRIAVSGGLLRGLASRLHAPPPLTPRESERLLRAVQDSFRQHLEAPPSQPLLSGGAPYASPNAHLGAVLRMAPFLSDAAEARAQREARVRRFLVDPVAVFEEHVALGTASANLARSCLARHNDLCKKGGRPSAGGSRVLMGLVHAGLLEHPKHGLAADMALAHHVVVALVHEGRQDLVANWTLAPLRAAAAATTATAAAISRPRGFVQLVEKHFGLEKAVQLFFAFYDGLLAHASASTASATTTATTPATTTTTTTAAAAAAASAAESAVPSVLGVVGRELCMAKAAGPLPDAQLERLLATSARWSRSSAEHAMVQLRFGRNVQPGLQFVAAIDGRPAQWWAELAVVRRKKLAQLGIELAQECLAQRRPDDAVAVANVVSRRFAAQLGSSSSSSSNSSSSSSSTADEAAEHLDVFREIFAAALLKKKLEPSLA